MKSCLALLSALALYSASVHAEPCAAPGEQQVSGVTQCLRMRHYGPDDAPVLLVWLHGDVSSGGPANYHFALAQKATDALAAHRVQSVALVRPGYPDGSGESSSVDPQHSGRADHYTRENVAEVGAAIRHLKAQFSARQVIVVGHSGGAATAAILLGADPQLFDAAVLVSCPCDLAAWRAQRGGRAWSRSENPLNWTAQVPASARVVALTGTRDDNTGTDLARRYVEALADRGVKARFGEVAGASHNEALRSADVIAAITSLIATP